MAEVPLKRRLPLWMSSSASASTTSTIIDKKVSSFSIEEEEEELSTSKLVVAKQVTKKKGKKSTCHEEVDGEDDLSLPSKRKGKKQPARSQKPKKPKTSGQKIDKKEDSTGSLQVEENDNEELTVDDLMSIAREYVKADEERENQQRVTTQPELRTQIAATSITSRNVPKGVEVSSAHSSSILLSDPDQTKSRDQEHSAREESTISSRTGDSTQDMLDLFLGPLLRKPRIEGTQRETFTETISLDYDFERQNQKDDLRQPASPLMKKKSSLRDKVAMLLD